MASEPIVSTGGVHFPLIHLLSRYPQRGLLAMGIALYAFLFCQLYQNWLNPIWAYYGFTYRDVPLPYFFLSWILILLPALWMPLTLTRPSQFIYWMLFLVVYVPSIFMVFFIHLMPDGDLLLLVLHMFAGLFLMGLGYRLKLGRFPTLPIPRRVFWGLFALITTAFAIWIMVVFRGQMRIVSTEAIYSQRATAKAVIGGGLVGYPMLLLSGMIDPVLMALGLVHRKYWLFVCGAMGQILIFACAANKSVATSIIFIPIFYFILKKGSRRFGLMMVALFCAVSLVLFILNPSPIFNASPGSKPTTTGIGFALTSLVLMRTIGSPGLLMAQYHCFFSHHPLTYMSHVNGINQFIRYPYVNPLGIELGNYFMGRLDLNLNANLWATDGIAGLWLPGILLISLLCAMVFWCLDSLSSRQSILFSALTVVFAALNLCNASLFTGLISGGLLPLMVFLHLMPSLKASTDLGKGP